MEALHNITGVILAGGGGRRMFPQNAGGGDKANALVAGRPLIAHVAESIRPQVADLIINANGNPARFDGLALPVVPDTEPGHGPLAGLLAAMDWALRSAIIPDAIVSVSTDTPFLPDDLVGRLLAVRHALKPAIAMSEGRIHPVIGLWPLNLRDAIAETLRSGHRSVEKFAVRHEAIAVPFALRTIGTRTVDPFFNANTPEELALAEAILLDTSTTTSG